MRLKLRVILACFLILGAVYVRTPSKHREPSGTETGIWRGRVSSVTSRGASLDSLWISSPDLGGRADLGDSVLVLGRRRERFITPWALRIKPAGGGIPMARRAVLRHIQRMIPDSLAQGLTCALLLGYRGLVPAHTAAVFRDSGTAHLLALSGMHTGIVAGLILGGFRLLFGRRPMGSVLAVLALVLFILLSGSRPSTVRAGIMAGLVVLRAGFHGGKLRPLAVWCMALVPLAAEPALLHDPGTRMSYGSVLALILLGRSFRGWKAMVLTPLYSGMVVIVALAPVSMGIFGRINPAGALSTLISLPMMTTVMLLGTLGTTGLGSGLLEGVCRVWIGLLRLFSGLSLSLRPNPGWTGVWSVMMGLLFLSARWRAFRGRFR